MHYFNSSIILFKIGFDLPNQQSPFWRCAVGESPLVAQSVKSGATTITGFKKQLFNQVIVARGALWPPFNRRKHNHSHHLIVDNQLRKLSKVFGYLSKQKISFFVGSALKSTYNREEQKAPSLASSTFLAKQEGPRTPVERAIPNLMNVIETDTAVLLTRNQSYTRLSEAKQSINHSWYRPRFIQIAAVAARLNHSQKRPLPYKGVNNLATKQQPRWIAPGEVLRNG